MLEAFRRERWLVAIDKANWTVGLEIMLPGGYVCLCLGPLLIFYRYEI